MITGNILMILAYINRKKRQVLCFGLWRFRCRFHRLHQRVTTPRLGRGVHHDVEGSLRIVGAMTWGGVLVNDLRMGSW